MPENSSPVESRETQRVEAFSDGVFAIAITLLILEIRVPQIPIPATGGQLLRALLAIWPSFLAFLMSFWVVLIMWVNHHELFRLARRSDYRFFFANGMLLMSVTFIPFPTAVLARFLGTPAAQIAAAFYCAAFVLISISYLLLFESIAWRRRLVSPDVSNSALATVRRTYRLGLVVYIASTFIALWNAWLGLTLCSSLWLVWTTGLYRDRGQRRSHTAE